MATKEQNEEILHTMAASGRPALFTNRNGKQIQMEMVEVPVVFLPMLYRFQEDFEDKGEYLSLDGVLRNLLTMGSETQKARWKWGAINKETKNIKATFEKNVAETLRVSPEEMSPEEKLAHVQALFNDTQSAIQAARRIKR